MPSLDWAYSMLFIVLNCLSHSNNFIVVVEPVLKPVQY